MGLSPTIRTVCLAGSLAGAMVAAAPVGAQTLLSDELRITDGGGKVRYDMKILETAATPESIAIHKVLVKGVTPIFDPAQYGRYIVLFDTGPVTRISDVIGIYAMKSPTGNVLNFGFASDNETMSPSLTKFIAPGVAPPPAIPETGPIDVTRFLNPALQANAWKATFSSDVENGVGTGSPASVPEPGAWVMLLTGLGAIGAALRSARRRTSQPA